MAGRIPKHPDERIRRNKPSSGGQVVTKLPETHDTKVPPLPKVYDWTQYGRAYWRTLWRSPMAICFIEADIPALVRLTVLTELVHAGIFKKDGLAEMRQLEDRFGLSPLARRRLQYDITKAEKQQDKQPDAQPVDERFLRVVGDDA